jgi:hypothetical protein
VAWYGCGEYSHHRSSHHGRLGTGVRLSGASHCPVHQKFRSLQRFQSGLISCQNTDLGIKRKIEVELEFEIVERAEWAQSARSRLASCTPHYVFPIPGLKKVVS